MKTTYVWRNGDWVPVDKLACAKSKRGMQVISDIQPYKSMRTGEMITGRRQHRDHLRAYGLRELGNDMPSTERSSLSRQERINDIRRSMGDS